MYYVCIENNQVSGIQSYKPNVPANIEVVEISDDDANLIEMDHGYFDVSKKKVLRHKSTLIKQREKSDNAKRFLNSTDWKVLRHIRETNLGKKTTLSDAEYLRLEKERDAQSKLIK